MNIVSKSFENANIVFVLPKDARVNVEPAKVFGLFPQDATRGATFVDDSTMEVKVFHFPQLKLKLLFEQNRLRIDDASGEDPATSKRGLEAHRLAEALLVGLPVQSQGFNYDLIYRFDNVIPQQAIMKSFVAPEQLEDVRDFGWQFSIVRNKGAESRTYFFKAVSPLEMGLHVNFHFNTPQLLASEELQKRYAACYQEADTIFKHLTF